MESKNFSLLSLEIKENEEITKFKKTEYSEYRNYSDIRKILKLGTYTFENTQDMVPDNFYGKNISLHAIVGKNGSGKTTLLDVIYRMLNNLGCKIEGKGCNDHSFVLKVNAVLKFRMNNKIYRLEVDDTICKLIEETVDGKDIEIADDQLKDFTFFTLATNYSLYAFNPDAYNEVCTVTNNVVRDKWTEKVFKDSPSYSYPLVFAPYRKDGIINYRKEEKLSEERLLAIIAFLSHKGREKYRIIKDYKLWEVFCKLDYQKVYQHYIVNNSEEYTPSACEDRFKRTDITSQNNFAGYLASLLIEQEAYLYEYGLKGTIIFLACELLYLCKNNETYNNAYIELSVLSDITENIDGKEKSIDDLLEEVTKDTTLYTEDIRKTIDFLKFVSKEKKILYEDTFILPKDFENKDYDQIYAIINQQFPLVYKPQIRLFRELDGKTNPADMYFIHLSSGEKQMLCSIATIIHHLYNANKYGGYTNLNLILDEIELCAHPEMKRQYISTLINMLHIVGITDRCHVNILMSTHSPFILSDIPSSNVLFLQDGKPQPSADKKTLGANVYDLLKDGFFMDNSMGGYVQETIEEIIDIYHLLMENRNDSTQDAITLYNKRKDTYQYLAENICDSYLKRTLSGIMNIISKKIGNA